MFSKFDELSSFIHLPHHVRPLAAGLPLRDADLRLSLLWLRDLLRLRDALRLTDLRPPFSSPFTLAASTLRPRDDDFLSPRAAGLRDFEWLAERLRDFERLDRRELRDLERLRERDEPERLLLRLLDLERLPSLASISSNFRPL